MAAVAAGLGPTVEGASQQVHTDRLARPIGFYGAAYGRGRQRAGDMREMGEK
jgi:hypothetical protein